MIDGKVAAEGATAGLELLNRLVKMLDEAKSKGSPIALSKVIAEMPVAAHDLAQQYLTEIEKLEGAFDGDELRKKLSELESERRWWQLKRYVVLRRFRPKITAIVNQLETLLDDFVAVAHCKEAENVIADAFRDSNAKVAKMRADTDLDTKPLGEVLKNLHEHARGLKIDLDKIMQGRTK